MTTQQNYNGPEKLTEVQLNLFKSQLVYALDKFEARLKTITDLYIREYNKTVDKLQSMASNDQEECNEETFYELDGRINCSYSSFIESMNDLQYSGFDKISGNILRILSLNPLESFNDENVNKLASKFVDRVNHSISTFIREVSLSHNIILSEIDCAMRLVKDREIFRYGVENVEVTDEQKERVDRLIQIYLK